MAQPTPVTPRNNPSHAMLHNFHVNVKAFGATGDGTTDDTAAVTNAAAAAGEGGAIYFPGGTFVLGDWTPSTKLNVVGAGMGTTVLKAKSGATRVIKLASSSGYMNRGGSIRDLTIDGNAKASEGLQLTGLVSPLTSFQNQLLQSVQIQNCSIALRIGDGAGTQTDKTLILHCWFNDNTTGILLNSVNAQQTTMVGGSMDTHTIGVNLTAGWFHGIGMQQQSCTTGFQFNGGNTSFELEDVITEGDTVTIDGAQAGAWPDMGSITLRNCVLQGTSFAIKLGGSSQGVIAEACRFNGAIGGSGSDAGLYFTKCQVNGGYNITGSNWQIIRWDLYGTLSINQVALSTTAFQFGPPTSTTIDTVLYRGAANALQTDDVLRDHKGTPTYSTSITPVATDGDWQTITVTNATAFTINAPTSPPDSTHSQELTIEIFNNSGGAMGAITWNAAFVNVGGAFTNPANTKKRFIAYKWNGASWIETSRAGADY